MNIEKNDAASVLSNLTVFGQRFAKISTPIEAVIQLI